MSDRSQAKSDAKFKIPSKEYEEGVKTLQFNRAYIRSCLMHDEMDCENPVFGKTVSVFGPVAAESACMELVMHYDLNITELTVDRYVLPDMDMLCTQCQLILEEDYKVVMDWHDLRRALAMYQYRWEIPGNEEKFYKEQKLSHDMEIERVRQCADNTWENVM